MFDNEFEIDRKTSSPLCILRQKEWGRRKWTEQHISSNCTVKTSTSTLEGILATRFLHFPKNKGFKWNEFIITLIFHFQTYIWLIERLCPIKYHTWEWGEENTHWYSVEDECCSAMQVVLVESQQTPCFPQHTEKEHRTEKDLPCAYPFVSFRLITELVSHKEEASCEEQNPIKTEPNHS